MTGGIILAAGASTRMGRFKPMLPIGDTTFIKLLIQRMKAAGAETIVAVTGYRGEELKKHLADTDVICVRNERFYCTQMYDSLKIGLRALPRTCDAVFLTPVDAVMAPAPVYRALLEGKEDLVRPSFEGWCGHPMLIRRPLFGPLLSYGGADGLRGAVRALDIRTAYISAETDLIRCDADTPEDYRRILGRYDRETGNTGRVHIEVELQVTTDDVLCDGSFFQLLELIGMLGSLQSAANVMHMSYSKAWKMVRHVEDHVSRPLLRRRCGGEDGGGSELTDEGRDFLNRYIQMKTELDETAEKVRKKYLEEFRV